MLGVDGEGLCAERCEGQDFGVGGGVRVGRFGKRKKGDVDYEHEVFCTRSIRVPIKIMDIEKGT